jgi:hypothetical protein
MVGVLLLLVVVLGGFVAALLYARKKGWLERWGVVASVTSHAHGMRVEQVLRLSPRSSLYRVRDGGQTIVILESNGAAQVIETAPAVKDEP